MNTFYISELHVALGEFRIMGPACYSFLYWAAHSHFLKSQFFEKQNNTILHKIRFFWTLTFKSLSVIGMSEGTEHVEKSSPKFVAHHNQGPAWIGDNFDNISERSLFGKPCFYFQELTNILKIVDHVFYFKTNGPDSWSFFEFKSGTEKLRTCFSQNKVS